MKNPMFRLEGVVKSKDNMEDFEGPLVLILQLLSKNKIEIKDIKISQLLDQYMEYLDEMKSMDLEIASEFVAMASHLVYIKTRMLLTAEEEPSELEELMSSLEKLRRRDILEKVHLITETFEEMYTRGAGTITKPAEPDPEYGVYRYVHDKDDLIFALSCVFSREDAVRDIPQIAAVPVPKRLEYSISEKSGEIIMLIRKLGSVKISELLNSSKSKTELVATFVAILELCRAGKIGLEGEENDETICSRAPAAS